MNSLWRYRDTLAIDSDDHVVSLGEGQTPLVEIETGLSYKLEYLNPSGSFKDRGAALVMSRLKSLGVGKVIEDSSGNGGSSYATYAARAGISCDIYVPANTSKNKLRQIEAMGAKLVPVEGSRDEVGQAAKRASVAGEYAGHNDHPWFVEGTKTFAYEVYEQCRDKLPEAIFFPVGNGSLLYGTYKGFRELLDAGFVDRIPKMIGVQSENFNPIVREYHSDTQLENYQKGLAEGIAIAKPSRMSLILKAVRESGGDMLSVSEEEIEAALGIAHAQGFYIEATSAVALAGHKSWSIGTKGQKALVALTGSGLKTQK